MKTICFLDCNQNNKRLTGCHSSVVRMGSVKSVNAESPPTQNHCVTTAASSTFDRRDVVDTSCCENIRLVLISF